MIYKNDKHTFIPHRLLKALQELFQYFLLSVAGGIQAVRVPEMVGPETVGDVGDGGGEMTGR